MTAKMEDIIRLPIYELYSRLSDEAIDILRENPTMSSVINTVEQQTEYWKEKTENLFGYHLPFVPEQGHEREYWKELYNGLVAVMKMEPKLEMDSRLFMYGRYEYLWIEVQRRPNRARRDYEIRQVLSNVVKYNDVPAMKLLSEYISHVGGVIQWQAVLTDVIARGCSEMFTFVLDNIDPNNRLVPWKHIIENIARVANVEYYKQVVEKFKYMDDIDKVPKYAYRTRISTDHEAPSRVVFLKYLLSLPYTYMLSNYGNLDALSLEEAAVIAASDNVEINEVKRAPINTLAILYDSPRVNDAIRYSILKDIGRDDDVLEKFLSGHDIKIPKRLLRKYASFNNRSLEIATHFGGIPVSLLLLNDAIEGNAPIPLEYIYEELGFPVRALETYIMTAKHGTQFGKTLPLFIKFGISLNMVGERIAFSPSNNERTIRQLMKAGYPFETISHDLVLQRKIEHKSVDKLIAWFGLDKKKYAMYDSSDESVDEFESMEAFMHAIEDDNVNYASKLARDPHIEPYTNEYGWVYKLKQSMFKDKYIHSLLLRVKANLEKQILRRVVEVKDNYFPLHIWLMLATGLGDKVVLTLPKYFNKADDDVIVFKYGKHKVKLMYKDIFSYVYAGLNFFSSTGEPLTSSRQRYLRQLELLPR